MRPAARRGRMRSPAHQADPEWQALLHERIQTGSRKRCSWPCTFNVLMRDSHPRFSVRLGEAVFQKSLQWDILLADVSGLFQLSGGEQIEHGANRGGRRNLNGTQRPATYDPAVDLIGVGLLHKSSLP